MSSSDIQNFKIIKSKKLRKNPEFYKILSKMLKIGFQKYLKNRFSIFFRLCISNLKIRWKIMLLR